MLRLAIGILLPGRPAVGAQATAARLQTDDSSQITRPGAQGLRFQKNPSALGLGVLILLTRPSSPIQHPNSQLLANILPSPLAYPP